MLRIQFSNLDLYQNIQVGVRVIGCITEIAAREMNTHQNLIDGVTPSPSKALGCVLLSLQ